jgi:CheY-like chemotaxis protein
MSDKDKNLFIDTFPLQVKKIRRSLESGDHNGLTAEMTAVCDLLAKIDADSVAGKYRGKISGLRLESPGDIEAFAEEFILEISALSIDMQMAAHKSKLAEPFRAASGTKVLAVDNAVMFLNTLKRLLADAPYELVCLTSGEEALMFLESNKPDVILLDIEMPVMDGYELAQKIKQRGHKAPIIFITANSDREYVDKAVEVGAAGLLMKPLRINQLLAKLKEFI